MAHRDADRRPMTDVARGVYALVRRAMRAVLLTGLVFVLASGDVRAQGGAGELAVKATYLYKFPPFVQWPEAAIPPSGFTICIVGEDPFGGIIDRAVSGQQVQGRPILIRRMATFNGDGGCQMIYAVGSPMQSVASILAAARGKPILTVTDDTREAPGIFNFVIAENRVRFEVDDQLAAEGGLVISSKLLSLAFHVRSRS